MIGAAKTVVKTLASLWLTLACLVAAALIALAGEFGAWSVGSYMAVPFAGLFVNLMAALLANAKLRRQGGLLGFHLALAALALLAAGDRLTALSGHVEVTEGAPFQPSMVEAQAGPLHPWALDRVRFVQGTFAINYAPGMKRRDTVSTIYMPQGQAGLQTHEVGDDKPLVVSGYRFYTSFNKGFAPVLTFVDARNVSHSGSVHLPSYPLNHFKQGNSWTPPGSDVPVKLWLHLPEPVYVEDGAWRFDTPDDATLVVMHDGRRAELRPGDDLRLASGRLRYEGLRTWMGYTISYNPLVPWMLAAVLIAVLSLAWHVAAKTLRVPWQSYGRNQESDGVC